MQWPILWQWMDFISERTGIQIRLALPRHAVTITQWHQVIYTAVVTWQYQWQWKCVGRQCNTLISRIVIVWSPCMPGIELTSTFKSNSLGFGKLSPCKCGSYLGMYSAFPYIWINHWHFLFEHMHAAYAGPDPDSHNSRTPIWGQAKQFHDTLSVCPPLLHVLASIHFCNRSNDIQHSGISSID